MKLNSDPTGLVPVGESGLSARNYILSTFQASGGMMDLGNFQVARASSTSLLFSFRGSSRRVKLWTQILTQTKSLGSKRH